MCASEAREEVQDRDRAILRLRWNEHAKRHLALGRLALVREHFLLGWKRAKGEWAMKQVRHRPKRAWNGPDK
jgi:hypothetical protein